MLRQLALRCARYTVHEAANVSCCRPAVARVCFPDLFSAVHSSQLRFGASKAGTCIGFPMCHLHAVAERKTRYSSSSSTLDALCAPNHNTAALSLQHMAQQALCFGLR